MSALKTHRSDGFTLIEIIIGLIVASVLGTLVVQVMGVHLTESPKPLIRAQEVYSLQEVMESVTEEYNSLMASSTDPLIDLVAFLGGYSAPYSVRYSYLSGFDGDGNETAGTSTDNILKVTVSRGEQRLTSLFTK